jgi:ElaB/YqjD/DUF883 family membrane-anchored ribosome-binding protein
MTPNTTDETANFGSRSLRKDSFLNNVKETVAQKLKDVAGAIDERVEHSATARDSLRGYGHQASRWLNHSADYVRDIDVDRVKNDVGNQVRQHPGRSLLIAGAVGVVLGALFRRR